MSTKYPDCRDCRWNEYDYYNKNHTQYDRCMFPPFWKNIKKDHYISAIKARAHEDNCGLEGKHFEHKYGPRVVTNTTPVNWPKWKIGPWVTQLYQKVKNVINPKKKTTLLLPPPDKD